MGGLDLVRKILLTHLMALFTTGNPFLSLSHNIDTSTTLRGHSDVPSRPEANSELDE